MRGELPFGLMRLRHIDYCAPLSFGAVCRQPKMVKLSFVKSTSAQTAMIALATVAALAMLAVVASYWSWQWIAPAPQPRAPRDAIAATSAAALFGNLERDRSSPASTESTIRLLGIVADTVGRKGYAVMRVEPREIVTVREGEDIAPGIRLAEVAADRVILERGGTRETLRWPQKNTATESVALPFGK